ncbi:MAG: SRPBCC family protein [Thermoproteota archaeon]
MEIKEKYSRHYEESTVIRSDVKSVFAYADDFTNFSSHMNRSSWMMGGGSMNIHLDEGRGQKVGSHIRMNGKVFGINLFLDEVITSYEPPFHKEWQTVEGLNLIVIGHYKLGFEIELKNGNSKLRIYIEYDLPVSARSRWLGRLFGRIYAKWCIRQMINGVKEHFK